MVRLDTAACALVALVDETRTVGQILACANVDAADGVAIFERLADEGIVALLRSRWDLRVPVCPARSRVRPCASSRNAAESEARSRSTAMVCGLRSRAPMKPQTSTHGSRQPASVNGLTLVTAFGALVAACSLANASPRSTEQSSAVQSCQTLLTPSSSGSITDASGNVWTLSASGDVEENGAPVAGGGGTAALTYVDSTQTIWGQDAGSGQWYSWNGSTWVGPSGTDPTAGATLCGSNGGCGGDGGGGGGGSGGGDAGGGVDAGSDSGGPTGTRDPSRYPGADGQYWSLPLQTTASWITSGPMIAALQQGTPSVRSVGNYCVDWVVGGPNDPDCVVTDGQQSFTIKVPAGTTAENSGHISDDSLGGSDSTRPFLGWSCNGALIDGAAGNAVQPGGSTITCSVGLLVFDTTGPVMEDAVTGMSAYQASDNAIGNLPDDELAQAVADPSYVPPHTIAVSADPSQVSASLAWPAVIADPGDTGPIPEGSLIGIPYDVPKPAGLTRGGSLVWDIFQRFGGIIYNTNGSGAIQFETYAQQASTQALADDMNASFPSIMPYLAILASDGSPGSQTSADTAKGMIGGARADAFPAPPLLDTSIVGTHPQWYATSLGFFFHD